MLQKVLAFAALALVVLVASAGGASAASKSFTVTATNDDEGNYWFEFEGVAGKNPTVEVAAGDEVTLNVKIGAGVHNLHVGAPVNRQTEILSEGQDEVLTFTVPSGASTIEYWCDPHKGLNMAGKFTIAGAEAPPATKESPGFEAGVLVVALGAAVLLLRRRA